MNDNISSITQNPNNFLNQCNLYNIFNYYFSCFSNFHDKSYFQRNKSIFKSSK